MKKPVLSTLLALVVLIEALSACGPAETKPTTTEVAATKPKITTPSKPESAATKDKGTPLPPESATCLLAASASLTSRGDLAGPGGERVLYSPFFRGERIGLSVRYDIAAVPTEEVELASAGYETSLLYTSEPDAVGYYHPLPQIMLVMSDDKGENPTDQLLFASPALSKIYPGRRAALNRILLSRDRTVIEPVEVLGRSGTGGGYTSYYGMLVVDGPGGVKRVIAAGEAETRGASENLNDPLVWEFRMDSIDAILGAYDLGETMSAAKEIFFGAAPDELSGVSWIVENGGSLGESANGLYVFGSMENAFGKNGGQIIGHVTELGKDPTAADYLIPKRSWVIGREGFPCGTQTMLTTGLVDPSGNLFAAGRTDATEDGVYVFGNNPMHPYLVRLAPDGSSLHKVFRFDGDFDLATFAFGPLVLGPSGKSSDSFLYWAITAYEWMFVFKIDPSTLEPDQVLAIRPAGLGGAFSRNFFSSAALHEGRLYVSGSFSAKEGETAVVRGFLLVLNAADLSVLNGFALDSPVDGYEINMPTSLAVDAANPGNIFLAGVAGRPTDAADREEFRTYVVMVRIPK